MTKKSKLKEALGENIKAYMEKKKMTPMQLLMSIKSPKKLKKFSDEMMKDEKKTKDTKKA